MDTVDLEQLFIGGGGGAGGVILTKGCSLGYTAMVSFPLMFCKSAGVLLGGWRSLPSEGQSTLAGDELLVPSSFLNWKEKWEMD